MVWRRGSVQTVLGLVPANGLGVTLPHEHLLCDLTPFLRSPRNADERAFAEAPVTIDMIGRLRYYPYSNRANLSLTNEAVAIDEAARYRQAGGAAIVDATSGGIGRNPAGLAQIARATGLHVIMGSGYYVSSVHPPELTDGGEPRITEEISGEIENGAGSTGIRPGIIGEVGLSWPPHPQEYMVLRAAARAQRLTGAPLVIHPGRHPDAPLDAIRVVEGAGGDPTHTIMCHLCRTLHAWEPLVELARTGCFLEYDLFGQETSYYQSNPAMDMVSDAQRIQWVRRLVDAGYRDRVLLSDDVANKYQLVRYGGYGYAHILVNIVPRLRQRGFVEDDVRAFLVDNPAKALAFR
jgi:phosphotriesterase-related protein